MRKLYKYKKGDYRVENYSRICEWEVDGVINSDKKDLWNNRFIIDLVLNRDENY